jgi:hypothetical protein
VVQVHNGMQAHNLSKTEKELRTIKQIRLKARTENWQCCSIGYIIGKTISKAATERRKGAITSSNKLCNAQLELRSTTNVVDGDLSQKHVGYCQQGTVVPNHGDT